MKQDEHTKQAILVATNRFLRRAKGRITKKDARELGKRYGSDLHWKYMRVSGDKLAMRRPGDFARIWSEYLGEVFKRERRAPRRWTHGVNGPETARHLAFYFAWLGPSSGMWPGDRLAYDADHQGGGYRKGAWLVACASDCPCGKCWRPREECAA